MAENAPHSFHPSILREYDVRGIVGETLSVQDAEALGRAFGTMARRGAARTIAVGYDGRLSSPELAAAVAQGLAACGLDVVRIGRGPTPMLYYATHLLPVEGGVMVTGSHNPPNYNGFKLVLNGASFFGDDIRQMGVLAAAADWETGAGQLDDRQVFQSYVDRLCADFVPGKELKVAWDAGNGAAGEAMTALAARLPGEHILLNQEIDGRFPSHHPDPTVAENLVQLRDTVIEKGCDLGVAFDGDGDRIGAVDGLGRILWGDQLMLLLARDVLTRHPGAPIIADVKASQVLFDAIEEAGGRAVMWKTGHSLIKSKMKELGSPFAGEMSAHLFFADGYYGFDDALYAAVRMLRILASQDQTLAQFRDSLPPVVNTPELRFACSEDRKWAVIDEVRARLSAAGAEFVDIDGVRVRTAHGWWLLRASNTQDVLVARCEAQDEAGLAELKADLNAQLAASGLAAPES